MEIAYSDGTAIEEKILQILRSSDNVDAKSSPGKEHYHYSWPIRYHLSPERAQLISHLNFASSRILEIGAGMGALSRHMAEHCEALYVVEGTQSRFNCLKERLRDLSNWDGEVSNVQDVKLCQTFDIACLYGVFEYSELYIKPEESNNPFLTHLHYISQFLNDQGVLILAIENQLGLKYLSGAPEDHTGKLFDGISNYSSQPTPRTFSKNQLNKILSSAGFSDIEYYYPFPDYKLVRTVISDNLMEQRPDFCADLSTLSSLDERSLIPRIHYFPEYLASHTFAEAGLLDQVANSFLVIASKDRGSNVKAGLLSRAGMHDAWHYSSHLTGAGMTTFQLQSNGSILCQKEAEASTSYTTRTSEETFEFKKVRVIDQNITEGKQLRLLFIQYTYFNEYKMLLEEFVSFLSDVRKKFESVKSSTELTPNALDATFFNCVRKDSSYTLYDLEWEFSREVALSWLILRNVLAYCEYCHPCKNDCFKNPEELYTLLCTRLSVQPNLTHDINLESLFQGAVSDVPGVEYTRTCLNVLSVELPAKHYPRDPQQERKITSLPPEIHSRVVQSSLKVEQWLHKHQAAKNLGRKAYNFLKKLCNLSTK